MAHKMFQPAASTRLVARMIFVVLFLVSGAALLLLDLLQQGESPFPTTATHYEKAGYTVADAAHGPPVPSGVVPRKGATDNQIGPWLLGLAAAIVIIADAAGARRGATPESPPNNPTAPEC